MEQRQITLVTVLEYQDEKCVRLEEAFSVTGRLILLLEALSRQQTAEYIHGKISYIMYKRVYVKVCDCYMSGE